MIVTRSHVRAILNRAHRVAQLQDKAREGALSPVEIEELRLLLAHLVEPPMRRNTRNSTGRQREKDP
jgi:hypothetical protein